MATIKKYNGSTWENAVVRKYGTASEIIVPPTTIYADGTAISTYTIKGNTVQNGTPTPSNPVPVVGVGELETTGEHTGEYKIPILTAQTTNIYLGSTQTTRQIYKLVLDGTENYGKDSGGTYLYYKAVNPTHAKIEQCLCTHLPNASDYPRDSIGIYATKWANNAIYFNFGAAVMDVQPSGNTVTGLKEYLAAQYAAGTPVTIWYILETPTTGIVNEPLMKIGTYADSISNAAQIPTTDGANSITVDTTVQPSEFTATWTGWHDASVKEYDGTNWQ